MPLDEGAAHLWPRPYLYVLPDPPAEESAAYLRVLKHRLADRFGARSDVVARVQAMIDAADLRAAKEKGPGG